MERKKWKARENKNEARIPFTWMSFFGCEIFQRSVKHNPLGRQDPLSPKPLVRASNSSKFFTDPKLLVEITQSFGVNVYRAAF